MGKIKLQAGKTQIGKKTGKVTTESGDRIVNLNIYFGNYCMPPVNNKFFHLEKKEYLKMLDDFLNSEEGSKYANPSQEEIDEAIITVINKENEYYAKVREQQKKQEAEQRDNAVKPEYVDEKIDKPQEVKPSPKVVEEKSVEPEYIYESEDDEEQEEKPKKKAKKKNKISKDEMDQLTLMYKKQAEILLIAVIFLTLVVALQMLLNLYLLTR